jgi:cytochrome P450/nitrite reductase/ring-hydroxylating ferredoxin subunit
MATTPAWTPIARSSELAGPGPHAASAGGRELVVVRTASGGLKAFEGRCPHQGALLGEGELDGTTLVCRNHRWRFSVETGQREGGKQCLRACPVREQEGEVEADVSALEGEATRTERPSRKMRDLPGPRRLPLLGTAHLLEPARLHLQLEEWAREHGTPYVYGFGPRDVVAFSNLDAIQAILRERPDQFRRPTNLEQIFTELGVAGVFSAEGASWRPQRRLSMEALSQRHLRGFYPTLARVAGRLRARWLRAAKSGETLDVCDELKRFTVDVTTQLVFGYDLDTLGKGDDVIQRKLEVLFPTFNRRLFSIVPWWRVFRLPSDRKVDRVVTELRQWLTGLVGETRARLRAEPARAERPSNFLEAMLVAHDENGKPFSDEIIFGNAMTMLLAGEDTTAYSLAWAVHEMLEAPREVVALRRELDETLDAASVPADIDTAGRLTYASAVASETMRLRSVAPLLFVEPLVDTVVQGVELTKGTLVVLLTRAPATSEQHFGAPAEFRPRRWIDATAAGSTHEPGAHLPFGSGPRICPGRSLALLEMKVALATIYRSFDIERVGASSDVGELFSFTMGPQHLRVRVHERARTTGVADVERSESAAV